MVRCFKCYQDFSKNELAVQCEECGDYKCPQCGACLCSLTLGEQRVVLAMMYTYERVLGMDYDFTKHSEIEERILASLT